MAWIPSAIGAIGSIAGGIFGANQARDDASTAYNRTRELDEWLGRNQIQWRVSDLEKAGLNKVLAAPGSLGGIGTGTAPAAQGGGMALASGISSAAGAGFQGAQLAAQTRLLNANASAAEAEAKLKASQTPGNLVPLDSNGDPDWERADGGVLGNLNAAQIQQGIRNARETWNQIKADITQKQSQTSLNDAITQVQKLDLERGKQMMDAVVQRAIAELQLTQAEIPEAQAMAKIMASPAGVWIKALQSVFGSGPLSGILSGAIGGMIGRGKGAVPPVVSGGKYEPQWTK